MIVCRYSRGVVSRRVLRHSPAQASIARRPLLSSCGGYRHTHTRTDANKPPLGSPYASHEAAARGRSQGGHVANGCVCLCVCVSCVCAHLGAELEELVLVPGGGELEGVELQVWQAHTQSTHSTHTGVTREAHGRTRGASEYRAGERIHWHTHIRAHARTAGDVVVLEAGQLALGHLISHIHVHIHIHKHMQMCAHSARMWGLSGSPRVSGCR
jgi:hypothetical protein